MDKIKVISLNRFFNSPAVKFEETQATIGIAVDKATSTVSVKTIKFTGVKEQDVILEKLADRLACVKVLETCFASGPKKCLIPFYKELWTRYLKTLVNNSDEYRWSTKLFTDRPMLQWPYFMLESAVNLPDATEEELKAVLEPSLSIVQYCLASTLEDIASYIKS